jgi:hypothetical protein
MNKAAMEERKAMQLRGAQSHIGETRGNIESRTYKYKLKLAIR